MGSTDWLRNWGVEESSSGTPNLSTTIAAAAGQRNHLGNAADQILESQWGPLYTPDLDSEIQIQMFAESETALNQGLQLALCGAPAWGRAGCNFIYCRVSEDYLTCFSTRVLPLAVHAKLLVSRIERDLILVPGFN